jgi:hypothetical protein
MADLQQEIAEQIAEIEAAIEEFGDAAERCRKIMLVAKAAIAAGAFLFAAVVLGLIRSDAIALLVAITAVLAGIGLFGSTRSTLQELNGKIGAYEALRTEMIDTMDLRTVPDG